MQIRIIVACQTKKDSPVISEKISSPLKAILKPYSVRRVKNSEGEVITTASLQNIINLFWWSFNAQPYSLIQGTIMQMKWVTDHKEKNRNVYMFASQGRLCHSVISSLFPLNKIYIQLSWDVDQNRGNHPKAERRCVGYDLSSTEQAKVFHYYYFVPSIRNPVCHWTYGIRLQNRFVVAHFISGICSNWWNRQINGTWCWSLAMRISFLHCSSVRSGRRW